jgi:hypothetical protein
VIFIDLKTMPCLGKKCPEKYLVDLGRELELELELIQTQMAQKPILRAEVGMQVCCANKASAERFRRRRNIGQIPPKQLQIARYLWVLRTPQNNKEEGARAKKLATCGTRGSIGRDQSVPFSTHGAYCSAPEP